MNRGTTHIVFHLLFMVALTTLLLLALVHPFLPGAYDSLALSISTLVQLFGVFGLLLLPVALLWLLYELRKQAQLRRKLPTKARRFYFALAAVLIGSLIALILAVVAFATTGLSFGILTGGIWLYILSKVIPALAALRKAESDFLNPTPFYLIVIPMTLLIAQLLLAAPLTASSRHHAITMSAEIIADIEAYHTQHGGYPSSLVAVWQDYAPSVVGTPQYHYAPSGDSYNLVFEQPRFLFDEIGIREFVVYNPQESHTMISHDSWILFFTPDELPENQGWNQVNAASSPHWKYFWFD